MSKLRDLVWPETNPDVAYLRIEREQFEELRLLLALEDAYRDFISSKTDPVFDMPPDAEKEKV